MAKILIMATMTGAMLITSTISNATGLFSGTVAGTFTDPQLSGFIYTDGILGIRNDTGHAVYTGFGTNSITWGDVIPGALGPNVITFTGKEFSNVPANTEFDLGTITYLDGATLTGNTFIYGATLTLSAGAGVDVHEINVGILTTTFTSTHSLSAPDNADFITFSDLKNTSFNVPEQQVAQAELYGMIVGDPQLTVTSIRLVPGASGAFIGDGTPIPVPEPATVAILGVAAAGLAGGRRLARRV